MPKRVPITFKTNSRSLFANMWIQTQVDLWLFDDAVGRKPFHAFQLSNDKIWKRLQPSYNLRCQLYRKEIRLQQRAQTIHANYDQHRPITWGKPQELFQFVKTSEYLQLENINSEACERTNSALRRITSSTTFMSPSMYMRSLTLFMADINITANKFKEKYFQSQSWKNDRKYCTILFYYMRNEDELDLKRRERWF